MVAMRSVGAFGSGLGMYGDLGLFGLDPAAPRGLPAGVSPYLALWDFGTTFGAAQAGLRPFGHGQGLSPFTAASRPTDGPWTVPYGHGQGLSPHLGNFIRASLGSSAPFPGAAGAFDQNLEDLLQLLVAYVLAYASQQASAARDAGSLNGQQGWGSGRSVPPSSWGAGGGGAGSGGSGGGGSGGGGAVGGSTAVPANVPTGRGTAGDFLESALAQNGDRYVYGAETNLNDANPSTFDCSELVQWAAAQAGVTIPDGSGNQEAWCRQHGTSISVEEALRTPGALLFKEGHVAISLGDGRTIEAKGSNYGVGIFDGRGRFTSGGLVPGMSYGGGANA